MRRIIMVVALLFVSISGIRNAAAFGGCEQDCQKCHALQKDEAREILSKMKMPDAKILDIKMSQVGGLWELAVEDAKGARKIVYVGFSKKYIVNGPIIELDTAANKTREKIEEINRPSGRFVDPSTIPMGDALVLGSPRASMKVVVFTDPD